MNSSAFFSSLGLLQLQPSSKAIDLADDELILADGPTIMPLAHLGFLTVSGADAQSFLHGQLTNEVLRQPVDSARPSAYCQAKGRMLASFVQWHEQTEGGGRIVLALSRELAVPIAKRLSMFVLRAKAKVQDASEDLVAFGWVGAPEDFPSTRVEGFELPAQAWGLSTRNGLRCVRLPDITGAHGRVFARTLLVCSSDRAIELWSALSTGAKPTESSAWKLFEIHSGIARIVAATQEQFVPQMVNFELIGGVNFKKGCYPGQEVVARSQYLGKLRRRMFLGRAAVDGIMDGADVLAPQAAEPVGRVVNAVANGHGGTDMLIETTLVATEGDLSVAGAAVRLLSLPYVIPAEQGAA